MPGRGWTIGEWAAAYRGGDTPQKLIPALLASLTPEDPAWISRANDELLGRLLAALADRLRAVGGDTTKLPLYGVPFAVKDNIDVAGFSTTAACPAFSYTPAVSATVVQRLVDAGAVVIGKTNLDQFATGLVGVRSPYGAVPNSFDARYVSGGSSSGSASVVARGVVPFALGTDTAGSGRVPAGFNNIVGLKPTRGALSTTGVVPACRTLDCVSIFSTVVEDARTVYDAAASLDKADPYSRAVPASASRIPARPRLGVPLTPEWLGDEQARSGFGRALAGAAALGATCVPLDFSPLHETAALLYQGPWVAERYAAIEDFITRQPEAVHPVVREIIFGAKRHSAVDTFKSVYRLASLKREADALLAQVDALLVPTTPTIYTIDAVEADPVRLNARLGSYTNFVNLLDWSALALPAGFRDDGLPHGVTLIAPAWHELALVDFGRRWQRHWSLPLGCTNRRPAIIGATDESVENAAVVRLAVVGAHLRGMPLNRELTERNASFVERATTSGAYRLYALSETVPPKPGLVRTGAGAPIEVELWDVPIEQFGSFVAGVPAPLGIGTLELADGRHVKGFICEPWAIERATDITQHGGWRAYLAQLR